MEAVLCKLLFVYYDMALVGLWTTRVMEPPFVLSAADCLALSFEYVLRIRRRRWMLVG